MNNSIVSGRILRKLSFSKSFSWRKRSTLPFHVPAPIERSPTALLEALAETVDVDVTAPHYFLINDPAMIPSRTQKKQDMYLCKEFGIRAARQLAEEWPTLFMFDRDKPRLPAFRPEKLLDPLVVEANEENLKKMIASRQVEDSVVVFEKLRTENTSISKETMVNLFNLLCYYNGMNMTPAEYREWHGIRNFFKGYNSLPPSRPDIVKLLFESVEKTADVYSAMICNCLKFRSEESINRFRQLLSEMQEKGFSPSEEVFNMFIGQSISSSLLDADKPNAFDGEGKPVPPNTFNLFNELKKMNRLGIRPSVVTFNAALTACLEVGTFENRWALCLRIVGEMDYCGVKPNLSTYELLLRSTFDTDGKEVVNLKTAVYVLDSTLKELEKLDSIEISQSTDERYFIRAMEVAVEANNSEMADQVESLCRDKKNRVRFSSFITETEFYELYVLHKARTMRIADFEDVFVTHIPRLVCLNYDLANVVFHKLMKNPIWSFTRRFIEESICSGFYFSKRRIMDWQKMMLEFPVEKLTELELYEYQELVEKLVNMMKDINDNDRIVVNVDVEPFERTMIERGFLKEISAKSDPEYKYKLCVS